MGPVTVDGNADADPMLSAQLAEAGQDAVGMDPGVKPEDAAQRRMVLREHLSRPAAAAAW